MLAAPLEVHETNWKSLDFFALGFPKALSKNFHQPNSPRIPVANQGNSCDIPLEIGAPWECASGDSRISGVRDFFGVSVFVLLLRGVHVCCYFYSLVFVRVVVLLILLWCL